MSLEKKKIVRERERKGGWGETKEAGGVQVTSAEVLRQTVLKFLSTSFCL